MVDPRGIYRLDLDRIRLLLYIREVKPFNGIITGCSTRDAIRKKNCRNCEKRKKMCPGLIVVKLSLSYLFRRMGSYVCSMLAVRTRNALRSEGKTRIV